MATVRRARNQRWGAVAIAVAALIATPALLSAAPVRAPELSAREVIEMALQSAHIAHEGLVQVDGRFGLPTIPISSGATPLLDSSTALRTWWVSDTSWRTDTLTASGQQEEFTTPNGIVGWDYEENTVTTHPETPGLRLPRATDLLPPVVARDLLTWIGPSDAVTALPARRVAGIAAVGASVVPTDTRTSLGHLDVWIDPDSGLPLAVDIYARGATTATFTSRFLDVNHTVPAAADLTPTISPNAHRSREPRRDIVAFLSQSATQSFPNSLAGLPALTTVGVPIGVASYGVGFARMIVLRLPDRLLPRILSTVGTTGQSSVIPGGRVARLPGSLLQVAILVTTSGAGYVLAGTLTPAAMDIAVRAAAVALPAGARSQGNDP